MILEENISLNGENRTAGENTFLAIDNENEEDRIEVFEGIATDFDGVWSDHSDPKVAKNMVPLLVKHSLGQNAPLAVITGKEFADAQREIAETVRAAARAQGIEIPGGIALIYANNGSIIYDIGLDKIVEQKIFDFSTLEMICELESVKLLLELYEHIEELRTKLNNSFAETHFRQLDQSTICLRLEPKDLDHPDLNPKIRNRIIKMAGKSNPSRFDIAEAMRAEFAKVGLGDIQISSTDRSIDLTPARTGKRAALEHFAQTTMIEAEDFLRLGDSPTGMDFGLLAAHDNETRTGFSNVPVDNHEIRRVQRNMKRKTKAPRVIQGGESKFDKVLSLLNGITVVGNPKIVN